MYRPAQIFTISIFFIVGCAGPPIEWSLNATDNVCALFGSMEDVGKYDRMYRLVVYKYVESTPQENREAWLQGQQAIMLSISAPAFKGVAEEKVVGLRVLVQNEWVDLELTSDSAQKRNQVFFIASERIPKLRETLEAGTLKVRYQTMSTTGSDTLNLGLMAFALDSLDACAS